MPSNYRKTISISRRFDMVAFMPDQIVSFLGERCPPERVHSLVFWTKMPGNLWQHPGLARVVEAYEQSCCLLTVTGMGGTVLEPGIVPAEEVLGQLPMLVRTLGDARRVVLRFDPIVNLISGNGQRYSNWGHWGMVLKAAEAARIRRMITSWMTPYDKVIRRLAARGWQIDPSVQDLKIMQYEKMQESCRNAGIELSVCSDETLPVSACIDHGWLTRCHPSGTAADASPAGGQRSRCGCAKSWDIGWYHACPGGCVYCYANPKAPSLQQMR